MTKKSVIKLVAHLEKIYLVTNSVTNRH